MGEDEEVGALDTEASCWLEATAAAKIGFTAEHRVNIGQCVESGSIDRRSARAVITPATTGSSTTGTGTVAPRIPIRRRISLYVQKGK